MHYRAITKEFLADQAARGNSPRTAKWYAMVFDRFERFLGGDTTLEEAIEKVRLYTLKMQEEKLSSASIGGHIRGLRAFFRFAYDEGYLEEKPGKKVKPYRERQRVPNPLTEDEVRAVVASLPVPRRGRRPLIAARDRSIIFLMLDSACRLGDILAIEAKDVHFDDHEIRTLGKGDKERLIPFSAQTARELRRYMAFRDEVLVSTLRLFITEDGTAFEEQGVRMMVRRLGVRAGVKLYPHKLRHTAAFRMLDNGIDPLRLQVILGHSTMAMTARYAHASKARLGAGFDAYSPLKTRKLPER